MDGLVYPYICPAGHWTQGYGLLCEKGCPPITQQEALIRLRQRIPYYINETLFLCPGLIGAPRERLAAIVDFCFNLGAARLKASTLRKRVNEQDWEGACRELEKWVYGGGKKLPGLVARRALEVNLIRSTL